MDDLSDDLLLQVFRHLQFSGVLAVSAVCRRWRSLIWGNKSRLNLFLDLDKDWACLANVLSAHPQLRVLQLEAIDVIADDVLITAAECCQNLQRLILPKIKNVSVLSEFPFLTTLAVSVSHPLSFSWLPVMVNLKNLHLEIKEGVQPLPIGVEIPNKVNLPLEQLSLRGLGGRCDPTSRWADEEFKYIWENAKKVRFLRLDLCGGVGGELAFRQFISNCPIENVEVRNCGTIVEMLLDILATDACELISFSLLDGGSEDGLLQFIKKARCSKTLKSIDLRLPNELRDAHLTAISENFRNLSALKIESSKILIDEGLKAQGVNIQDLALINCRVLERESGLMQVLANRLWKLRKLDVSYSKGLKDDAVARFLVSCPHLLELKVRGCPLLSSSMFNGILTCKLESLDCLCCRSIKSEGLCLVFSKCPKLRRIYVEARKADACLLQSGIQVLDATDCDQ